MATTIAKALPDAEVSGVSAILRGSHPVGTIAITSGTLSHSQADVPWEHIEASLRKWRVDTDLAMRQNCPRCKEKDTHYLRFCREPAVVATRENHVKLLAAAIRTCELKKSTAEALTAMYSLDTQRRHIDPGLTRCRRRWSLWRSSRQPD